MTTGNLVAVVQGASRGLGLAFAGVLASDARYRRVFATCREPAGATALRALAEGSGGRVAILRLDVTDEASIRAAASEVASLAPRAHLVVNAAGLLHEGEAVAPEKKLGHVTPDALARVFAVNAFGPLLVAKHFEGLLVHEERSVLANVSARVGSIGDDRAGGWYAYRASKAAQNMFTKNLSIEMARKRGGPIVVALHPGTVDTDLSRPFQRNVPPEKLFDADRAARQLLGIVDSLEPEESGAFFAWDRQPVPW